MTLKDDFKDRYAVMSCFMKCMKDTFMRLCNATMEISGEFMLGGLTDKDLMLYLGEILYFRLCIDKYYNWFVTDSKVFSDA